MSGLDRFSVYSAIAILVLGLLFYGLCGGFRSGVQLTAVSVTAVSVNDIPLRSLPFTHGEADLSQWLRLDFRSSPEILADKRVRVEHVSLCEDGHWQPGSIGPFVGTETTWAASKSWNGSSEVTYSVYLPIARQSTSWYPGVPAYDLRRTAKALCLRISLGGDFQIWKDSNVIEFSAERVSDALKAMQARP